MTDLTIDNSSYHKNYIKHSLSLGTQLMDQAVKIRHYANGLGTDQLPNTMIDREAITLFFIGLFMASVN